jgi:hypothetical protein
MNERANHAAIALLRRWMAEPDPITDEQWAEFKAGMEAHRRDEGRTLVSEPTSSARPASDQP